MTTQLHLETQSGARVASPYHTSSRPGAVCSGGHWSASC